MTDKKKDIGKEDFIELDKDQYRRKSNYKVYFYIFLVILFCFSIGAIFLKKTDFLTEFTEFNKQGDIQNNESLNYKNIIKSQEIDNNLSEIMRVEDSINKNQTDLEKSLEELQKDIYNNKKRLQQTQNTLIELEKDLSKFIDQYKLDSDYYYSQKYIILNTLLRIKTKFKKRENFDEELNILREKFNSNFEIQSLISSLQEANISKILTKTDLLEFLNYKINSFDQNLEKFIVERINRKNSLNTDIFSSKESFLDYLNDLVSSIIKVSRIEKNTPFKQNDISIETHLKSTLLETKEYLLNDDLERSVETIIRSSFDEEEIQKWINDIESLIDVKKNLEELEYILLELTGKEID